MKTAAWITLLAAALLAAAPASARPGDGREGEEPGARGRSLAERQEARQQRRAERFADDGQRGGMGVGGGRERCDGPCRMTPEERMQLRRDIHNAGRDLYRRGGPRRDRD